MRIEQQIGGKSAGYIVVGTAGHVDHGKTELVRVLTGVDTDRLKEEKERGISIELGFAPLRLPSGRLLGLVDVPGHERFIRQMLAGAAGIDLVLLVIAADEGVMPQTREHLDIINLLRVKHGIIVLSKIDLVEPDWLDLVEEEVREVLKETVLEDAPVVRVSSYTGEGLEELREALERASIVTPVRSTTGQARLPVDRVFSVTGFGTVATGTLWSGRLRQGDSLLVLPANLPVRVRGLQIHARNAAEGLAGQRLAVNLANIEVEEIQRGSTLVSPDGMLSPSFRLDAELYLLPEARVLEQRTRVRFHLGTAEIMARVLLIDREELVPGETALIQLQAETPAVAARGDRFVLRSYSPVTTIGGGEILNPRAVRHRRFDPNVLESLQSLKRGDPEELIEEALAASGREGWLTKENIMTIIGLDPVLLEKSLYRLRMAGKVKLLPLEGAQGDLVVPGSVFETWRRRAVDSLTEFHCRYPLRHGLTKEELRSRKFPRLGQHAFQAMLETLGIEGDLEIRAGSYVARADFQPIPSQDQRESLACLEISFKDGWFHPPTWDQGCRFCGLEHSGSEELLHYLLRQGILVNVAEELYFHREAVTAAKEIIRRLIGNDGPVELSRVRDAMDSSRKYVLPLLEYFDRVKFTKRLGDRRVLF